MRGTEVRPHPADSPSYSAPSPPSTTLPLLSTSHLLQVEELMWSCSGKTYAHHL